MMAKIEISKDIGLHIITTSRSLYSILIIEKRWKKKTEGELV